MLSYTSLLLVQSGKHYVPSIITNSPKNIKQEAVILMRNCDLLRNYTLKHVKYNKIAENFRTRHLAFIDDSKVLQWRDQLVNDLKTFYYDEGLELIGAVNDPSSFT